MHERICICNKKMHERIIEYAPVQLLRYEGNEKALPVRAGCINRAVRARRVDRSSAGLVGVRESM